MRIGTALIAGIAGAVVWAGCSAAQTEAPGAGVGKSKMVFDFEDASPWSSENDSPFETSTEHVTQGKKSLKIHYTNKPEWPNIWTDKVVSDWSGMRYLNVDIFLEGDMPADMGLWIRDKAMHKVEVTFAAGPGANTITIDLDELKAKYELDRGNVIAMCLYKTCKEEVTVYWDNMFVSERAPEVVKAKPVRMPDAELLTNGSFEDVQAPDDVGNPFQWWKARRWQGRSFLGCGQIAVFAGKRSAMLDGRGPCKIGIFTPLVKVQSPTRLKLTAYVQADGLQKGLYQMMTAIQVTDSGERGLTDAAITLQAGTYPWKKAELVFDVPEKCPFVKVFIQHLGPGRVWVDDISLKGVDLDAKCGVTWTDTGRELKVDPPLTTETPELQAKRAAAEKSLAALRAAVAEARTKGVETLYDEIPLVLGNLAFQVRWDLPEHLALRDLYADYVLQRSDAAIAHLGEVMDGKAPDLKVPPHPDFSKLKLKGRYFCDGDDPKIILSMQYHDSGELIRWFSPRSYYYGLAAVGASRYDVQSTAVWEAYQKYPETHRVYDDGWCGHIICDKYSAGGSSQRCVISLDSPKMREAIAKSIAAHAARSPVRPPNLYVNVGFEYSYVNYDSCTADLFRQWLARKYGKVESLNAVWKTAFKDFPEIALPSYNPTVQEPNPAKYYDFGEFNLWRFTDYMKWAKGEINKAVPGLPMTTGGGEPFGAGFWAQGIDEEGLIREGVNDVFLSETGSRALGVTSTMDLQRSLVARPTLILDPEYHALPNTCFLMFLHGCGLMDYWWWPMSEGDFDESSLRHSPRLSLEEVSVVMRTSLDVRRLARQIAPFPDAAPQIGLLYCRATLVQRDPRTQGHKTPYSLEMEKTYEAAVRLDTPVGFVSSRGVREGIPAGVKLMVVAGTRFVEEDVFAGLTNWVSAGGTLVVTPTSFVADQYNRKRDYLGSLGIELTSEELPELKAGEAKRGIDQSGEMDFIQGPVAKTIVSKEPKRKITWKRVGLRAHAPVTSQTSEAAGTIQTVKHSADWAADATYEGSGEPAILSRALGKGVIVYMAAQLTVDSRREFLDELMESLDFDRPIRALTPDGKYPAGVESRTVAVGGSMLTYLCNTSGKSVVVKLKSAKSLAEIWNLNADRRESGAEIALAPYETRIMRIKVGP